MSIVDCNTSDFPSAKLLKRVFSTDPSRKLALRLIDVTTLATGENFINCDSINTSNEFLWKNVLGLNAAGNVGIRIVIVPDDVDAVTCDSIPMSFDQCMPQTLEMCSDGCAAVRVSITTP